MPARAELTVRGRNEGDAAVSQQIIGEPTGEFYDVMLFFGIIDILQDYDISKKLEHVYKAMQYDATSISAVDPRLYSRRFRDFVFKAFSAFALTKAFTALPSSFEIPPKNSFRMPPSIRTSCKSEDGEIKHT